MSWAEVMKINSDMGLPLDQKMQAVHDSLYNRITTRTQYDAVACVYFDATSTAGLHIDGCGQVELYFWSGCGDVSIVVDGVGINKHAALLDGYLSGHVSRTIPFSKSFDLKTVSGTTSGAANVFYKY